MGSSSKSSGSDIAVILAALHGSRDERFLRVFDDRILSTAFQLSRAFRKIYRVSFIHDLGIAMGRYPEDMYDGYEVRLPGGNPWVLDTLALGEFYYRVASDWARHGCVRVTELNFSFLQSLAEAESRSSLLRLGQVIEKGDP